MAMISHIGMAVFAFSRFSRRSSFSSSVRRFGVALARARILTTGLAGITEALIIRRVEVLNAESARN